MPAGCGLSAPSAEMLAVCLPARALGSVNCLVVSKHGEDGAGGESPESQKLVPRAVQADPVWTAPAAPGQKLWHREASW